MLKILKRLNRAEVLQVLAGFVFILAQVWLDLKTPDYMFKITTLTQTPGSTIAEIINTGYLMLLCTLGSLVSAVVLGFFASRIAASFSKRLREELFAKVLSFSMQEINNFSTASLITRSTNDVTNVQLLIVMGMQIILRSPIMAGWAIFKIRGKGAEWMLSIAAAVLILLIIIIILLIFVMPMFRKMQTLTDDINRVARENLTGLRVVRAYNAENYQEQKFEAANAELTHAHLFTSRAMAGIMPFVSTVMSVMPLTIYLIGAYLIDAASAYDKLTLFSNMTVFTSYAAMVIMSFMMMAMIMVMLPRASVSAKRINEVLDTAPSIVDGARTKGVKGMVGEVEFKDVSFKYPGASDYVLNNINFTARKGEVVAIIGGTGAGKTTLINLILRFYDVSAGEILLDGVSVKDYRMEALRNRIGYVPQKAVLFKDTAANNIAYGDNGKGKATLKDIKKSAKIAMSSDFIEQMEGGYNAQIAQGGKNISGGQKQRISIARAICRKPLIYIFDDSFSALDYKTDRQLRQGLKTRTAGITSLIVAQRIGTVMDADKIIVLDEGTIAGVGRHKELLQTCAVYKEIAASQLSMEEL